MSASAAAQVEPGADRAPAVAPGARAAPPSRTAVVRAASRADLFITPACPFATDDVFGASDARSDAGVTDSHRPRTFAAASVRGVQRGRPPLATAQGPAPNQVP